MGLYPIKCVECSKSFLWFSGNARDQRCEECKVQTAATISKGWREELKKIAKAAQDTCDTKWYSVREFERMDLLPDDAIHAAAFDPDTALSLLDELERVTKERDNTKALLADTIKKYDEIALNYLMRNKTLEAQLREATEALEFPYECRRCKRKMRKYFEHNGVGCTVDQNSYCQGIDSQEAALTRITALSGGDREKK